MKGHLLTGRAAFARADVKDAKRRFPAADLEAYAASRGLQSLGRTMPQGYLGHVPEHEVLRHNILRGVLPGGAHGILYHETLAWPATAGEIDGNGTFWGVSYSNLQRPKAKDLLMFLPVIGWFFGDHAGAPKGKIDAFGIPVTNAATLVPEAALVADFSIDNRPKPLLVGSERIKLKDHGAPGWDVMSQLEFHPQFVASLMDAGLRDVLLALSDRPYALVRLRHGQLLVRVNGFVMEDAGLDALAGHLATVAGALRTVALPAATPKPFDEPLTEVDWPDDEMAISESGRFPAFHWLPALHAFAREHGMTMEEPKDLHRTWPGCPVPGRCFALMRGTVPGAGLPGRVGWFAEHDVATHNVGRNAVLVRAPEGMAPTEPWGERLPGEPFNFAVRDGVLAVWALRSSSRRGDLGDMPAVGAVAGRMARSGVPA